MNVKIVKLTNFASIPKYQTEHAAGFDFCAAIAEPIILKPHQPTPIPTGLAFEIPVGFEMQVRPHSGLAYKYNVTMFNGIGTIDADYRGEVRVLLVNHGDQDFVVEPDMRVAQGVIAAYEKVDFIETDIGSLSVTDRQGGYGSTGLK